MTLPDPEETGRRLAQTLVESLENLKSELATAETGANSAAIDRQLEAGLAAVEAMKQLMGGLVSEMRAQAAPPLPPQPPERRS